MLYILTGLGLGLGNRMQSFSSDGLKFELIDVYKARMKFNLSSDGLKFEHTYSNWAHLTSNPNPNSKHKSKMKIGLWKKIWNIETICNNAIERFFKISLQIGNIRLQSWSKNAKFDGKIFIAKRMWVL